MLSSKKLIVNKPFSKPGHILHTADADQFVTIKCVSASADDGEINIQDVADDDMFRLTVSDDASIWIALSTVKSSGILLKDFPLENGETIRVSVSQNLLGRYLVFGHFDYV